MRMHGNTRRDRTSAPREHHRHGPGDDEEVVRRQGLPSEDRLPAADERQVRNAQRARQLGGAVLVGVGQGLRVRVGGGLRG